MRWTVFALALCVAWSASASADVGVMRKGQSNRQAPVPAPSVATSGSDRIAFEAERRCDTSGQDCRLIIKGKGSIDNGALNRFNEVSAAATQRMGQQVDTVVLESLGGDLRESLLLGVTFRNRGLTTEVAPQTVCASACAYAFLGGRTRILAPDSYLGVHRFAAAGQDPGSDVSQRMVSLLSDYIRGMGVSESLLQLASQAGPSSMARVSFAQAQDWNVINLYREPSNWIIATDNAELVMSLQGLSVNSDRRAEFEVQSTRTGFIVSAQIQETTFYNEKYSEAAVSDIRRIALCRLSEDLDVIRQCVFGQALGAWAHGEHVRQYVARFDFSRSEVRKLLGGGAASDRILVTSQPGSTPDQTPFVAVLSTAQSFQAVMRAVDR